MLTLSPVKKKNVCPGYAIKLHQLVKLLYYHSIILWSTLTWSDHNLLVSSMDQINLSKNYFYSLGMLDII